MRTRSNSRSHKILPLNANLSHSTKRTKRVTKVEPIPPTTPTNPHSPWYRVFTKGDPEYDEYMATEWGFEKHGDVAYFEKLSLEGAQSGLSWLTILRKREAYRRVFHGFDPEKVSHMTDNDVERILAMEGEPRDVVVRHRGKITSVIDNAKCIMRLREENPSKKNPLQDFLWSFVGNQPIVNKLSSDLRDAPSKSSESEAMSKALKKRGFRFVGPTTCYALMQSCGMVIDHPQGTPEWSAALERLQNRAGGYQERS